jgi:hypothetical protein
MLGGMYSTVRVDLAPFCVLQILFSEIGQRIDRMISGRCDTCNYVLWKRGCVVVAASVHPDFG